MQDWQRIWRNGIAPLLSRASLEALREGLRNDDPRLVQGRTVMSRRSDEIDGACLVAYCGWHGEKIRTSELIQTFFTQIRLIARERLNGESADPFLDWYDRVPRKEMLVAMLAEVELALVERVNLDIAARRTLTASRTRKRNQLVKAE